ncbi:hypothetical protein PAXRUDRAFT_673447 [Paxillus rubicundulus Ve08.2h10]|uniref:Uncharacterized protein n=1 Tax=Paxillus rubicundulus Ve08.2h10 TaxID=930991 RepID=A0A0D0D237_9AGAM|nr:hypothetical protein PAXRUDRAFT_673447 [Paxillus rubicundulus Ve08.2h10]
MKQYVQNEGMVHVSTRYYLHCTHIPALPLRLPSYGTGTHAVLDKPYTTFRQYQETSEVGYGE